VDAKVELMVSVVVVTLGDWGWNSVDVGLGESGISETADGEFGSVVSMSKECNDGERNDPDGDETLIRSESPSPGVVSAIFWFAAVSCSRLRASRRFW